MVSRHRDPPIEGGALAMRLPGNSPRTYRPVVGFLEKFHGNDLQRRLAPTTISGIEGNWHDSSVLPPLQIPLPRFVVLVRLTHSARYARCVTAWGQMTVFGAVQSHRF